MADSILPVITVILILLASVDFYFGNKAFHRPEEIGRYLGFASVAAGVTSLSYLFSIRTDNYHHMSIMSSIYFAGIDWMLVSLIHFVYRFTGSHRLKSAGWIRRCICVYALFDTLVMIVNIFSEIAVHYTLRGTNIAPYAYEMKPLYIMHLVFTYLLVIILLGILVIKCMRTPKQYRNQYILIILAIIIVVILNAVFLYQENFSILSMIDMSIIGYSLGLNLMYWAAFEYRNNDMLKSLSMTIFENIDQGIVLFDYNREFIMKNKQAEHLLPEVVFSESMDCDAFLDQCNIPVEMRKKEQFSTQCETKGIRSRPLRCDYRRLQDKSGGTVGNLFVFTDSSNSIDLLTGFQHWETHRRYAAENPYGFPQPTTVVIFDISGLSEINQSFGREVGNQQIRNLARIMRKHLPDDTLFVRGYEAHLVAICHGHTEAEIMDPVNSIISACAGTVLYGMSSTVDVSQAALRDFEETESGNLLKTIDAASHSLQVKKLLSKKSPHSHTLTSLVRALQESDSDTEAHVQRTQKTGIALGRRIGLTDSQIADLRLLCLLHDVGKIGIPLEILNKPGKLTEQERAVLQTHPEKGYQIAMSSNELKYISRMILYHHERWDGKGYPQGLAGNSIPVLSRVISIVDSYDAMVNDRSYRKALTPEEAKAEIRRCAGTQFDPTLADEFLLMLEENPDISVGEKIGSDDVRFFMQNEVDAVEGGNTTPITYSRYRLDLDDIIIEVDDQFAEITGYTKRDAVGRLSQYDLIPKDDRAYYMMQVNNQFSQRNLAYLEHEIERKDGKRIWVVCYGKRYFDSAEKAFRSEILIFKSRGPKPSGAPPVE